MANKPRVWNKRDPKCPKDAVYVGRPSRWGNPFEIGSVQTLVGGIRSNPLTRANVIALYKDWVDSDTKRQIIRENLKGKDLVCWCAPKPCHADILLEIANCDD